MDITDFSGRVLLILFHSILQRRDVPIVMCGVSSRILRTVPSDTLPGDMIAPYDLVQSAGILRIAAKSVRPSINRSKASRTHSSGWALPEHAAAFTAGTDRRRN